MLTTRKVQPLEGGAAPDALIPTETRSFRVALSEQSIFVLARDHGEAPPDVLRIFVLDNFSVTGSVFKWTVTDDQRRIFEGRHQPISLYKEWFTMAPVFPLIILPGDHGFRVMFECTTPTCFRIHHASYVKRRWPELAERRF